MEKQNNCHYKILLDLQAQVKWLLWVQTLPVTSLHFYMLVYFTPSNCFSSSSQLASKTNLQVNWNLTPTTPHPAKRKKVSWGKKKLDFFFSGSWQSQFTTAVSNRLKPYFLLTTKFSYNIRIKSLIFLINIVFWLLNHKAALLWKKEQVAVFSSAIVPMFDPIWNCFFEFCKSDCSLTQLSSIWKE